MTIQKQARELELYATSTQRYYPQLAAIERTAQRRYDYGVDVAGKQFGQERATAYAKRALRRWLEAPSRHYLWEVATDDPEFRFAPEALELCAAHLAECMVSDCEAGYYREG